MAISVNADSPATLRSMRYSSIDPVGALQDSAISDGETAVAVSAPGAPGGAGNVVAVASLLGAEQATALHAITRQEYCVAAASPVLWNASTVPATRSISSHAP